MDHKALQYREQDPAGYNGESSSSMRIDQISGNRGSWLRSGEGRNENMDKQDINKLIEKQQKISDRNFYDYQESGERRYLRAHERELRILLIWHRER